MAEKINMNKALDELRRELESYIDLIQYNARLRKGKFDALMKEGFSREEALRIVISTPILK